MQTPTLSTAARAFLRDPDGFTRRMHERAENLFRDGYEVLPAAEIGLFLVHTPKGEIYPVNVLTGTCSCQYEPNRDLSDMPHCKHLLGIGELIEDMLTTYRQNAQMGDSRLTAERLQAYAELNNAWEAARSEAQCRQYEAEETGTIESDRADRLIRESGFNPY